MLPGIALQQIGEALGGSGKVMTEIQRSTGLNRSEELLARLCDHAFLPLWCYPNLYKKKGKELIDVLVVFGDTTLLFSDKDRQYPATGDPELDWARWKTKSITDAAEQLDSAEKWLRRNAGEVYLDPKCTQRHPLPIDPNGRIHKIIVARNARQPSTTLRNDTGGLLVFQQQGFIPRAEGRFEIDMGALPGFFHILDEVSLPILLKELDTAADFLDYLEKRERAFNEGALVETYSEEEALYIFLTSTLSWRRDARIGEFPRLKDHQPYIAGPGLWEEFRASDEYRRRFEANRGSYLWDKIVTDYAQAVLGGEAVNPLNLAAHDLEKIGRYLALESRTSRRGLSQSLAHALRHAQPNQVFNRTVLSRHRPDFAYVFSLHPRISEDDEEHRTFRRNYCRFYGRHVLHRTPSLKDVLLIATEMGHEDDFTFDFVVVHAAKDETLDQLTRDFAKERGWANTFHDLSLSSLSTPVFPAKRSPRRAWGDAKATRKRKRQAQRKARKRRS